METIGSPDESSHVSPHDPTLGESVNNVGGGNNQTVGQRIGLTHPIAAFFHCFFKIIALVFFLVLTHFIDFIVTFIVVVVCLALDFWVVKNISGRLLVGLRWWNQIKPDGANEWMFESLEGQRQIHRTEFAIFWISTLGFPFVWLILAFAELITIGWAYMAISLVALSFTLSNALGYLKCARQARQQVTQMVTAYVTEKAVEHITAKLTQGDAPTNSGSSINRLEI